MKDISKRIEKVQYHGFTKWGISRVMGKTRPMTARERAKVQALVSREKGFVPIMDNYLIGKPMKIKGYPNYEARIISNGIAGNPVYALWIRKEKL